MQPARADDRRLDRRGALVVAWSRVEGLAAFYALWAGIGLVMATVLYEPAFVVLANWFPAAGQRRRALTALILVAALASFIFLPLCQALIGAHGWRDALVILAVILAAIMIPIHALVLRQAPDARTEMRAAASSTSASDALRSAPFWLLSAARFPQEPDHEIRTWADAVLSEYIDAPVRSFVLTIAARQARDCLARDACALPA